MARERLILIDVRKSLRASEPGVQINMGPLIDMVFLLLIFFVVTTSFVKETGIEVQRSTAATAEVKEMGNIMLGISDEGQVFFEGRRIDLRSVRAHVERALAENPDSGVILVADRESQTGTIVEAMDQCRLAGALSVSLAARREVEP